MINLLLIFIIIVLGVLFSVSDFKAQAEFKRRTYIYIITLLLVLHSGLRKWDVGLNSDTFVYYNIFKSVSNTPWDVIISQFLEQYGKDPFYNVFQKAFQMLSEDYQVYLLVVAFIVLSSIGNFILKNTTEVRHAVIAFVFYMGYFYGFYSLTGTRQALATALLLWSFEFIKSRKFLFFILFVCVAGLFHLSALVFFPLYFIANFRKPHITMSLAVLGFPLVFYFKNALILFFIVTANVKERFGNYVEQYEQGGSVVLTLLNLLLGFLSLFIINKVVKTNPGSYRFYNMFALSIFFYPLQWVDPSAGRISLYFALVMLVWVPFLLDALAKNSVKVRRLIYSLTIILFIILTMFTFRYGVPYKFYWQ